MKYRTQFLNVGNMKIHGLFLLIAIGFVLNGCTALQEAQQQRQKRLDERRSANQLMLTPSDATIVVNPNPAEGKPHGESDHYTLTFAEDLQNKEDFDEDAEREMFARSALGYMESLYDTMHNIFGFKPKHKIHVILYNLYRGTNTIAVTRTLYSYGQDFRNVTGIEIHFPMRMYEKHGVRVHELTHAFTNIYFLPTWFNEGVAVLMQTEYAKGGGHPKFDNLQRSLELDAKGINELENWGGHLESVPLTHWRYSYAYTIVSELREQYGNKLYIKLFELMDADQLQRKLRVGMPTDILVYYISQAAGMDMVPFFQKLQFKFDVGKLEKQDILPYIQRLNAQQLGYTTLMQSLQN